MPNKPSKTAEIPAPAWLDRAGKRMFRGIVRQLPDVQQPLSEAKVDLISDLVEARQRIAALGGMLSEDLAENSSFLADKNRILALSRQIDSTTAFAHKLADRLGINGDAHA